MFEFELMSDVGVEAITKNEGWGSKDRRRIKLRNERGMFRTEIVFVEYFGIYAAALH